MIGKAMPYTRTHRPPRRQALLAGMLASVLIAAGCSSNNEFGAQPYFSADGGIESGVDPLSRGKRHFANGNFGLAIEAFEEARHVAPGSVNVLNALAVAYEEVGRPDLADSYFLEALDRDPASAQTYNNWAMAQLSRGNGERAQALLAEAVRLAPADEVVHSNIARAEYAMTAPAADQAVSPALPAGSLTAVIAELQGTGGDWGPTIRTVAPHVHYLQTLPPGSTAAAAAEGILPVVLYPQMAAVDIMPPADQTDAAPAPPAMPLVPVYTASLGAPDATGDAVDRPLAGLRPSAVPVHALPRAASKADPAADSLADRGAGIALAVSDDRLESPHYYGGQDPDGNATALASTEPALVRPVHDTLQDLELAAMTFMPAGPESDAPAGTFLAVSPTARIVGLEPAVAVRPEPMTIETWSTAPVAPALRSVAEPQIVVPADAAPVSERGTIVTPYGQQSAEAPPSSPLSAAPALLPPSWKPELPAETVGSLPDEATPATPDPADTAAAPVRQAERNAVLPGITVLAAVPPLVVIADAHRVAATMPAAMPVTNDPEPGFAATMRTPLVVAMLAAAKPVESLPAASDRPADIRVVPMAVAARITGIVMTAAMPEIDDAGKDHEEDGDAIR
jgi:hypothetical protein